MIYDFSTTAPDPCGQRTSQLNGSTRCFGLILYSVSTVMEANRVTGYNIFISNNMAAKARFEQSISMPAFTGRTIIASDHDPLGPNDFNGHKLRAPRQMINKEIQDSNGSNRPSSSNTGSQLVYRTQANEAHTKNRSKTRCA